MLGWNIYVWRQEDAEPEPGVERPPSLAFWRTGLGGLDWISELVGEGKAMYLDGNGYPTRYVLAAATILSVLEEGPPDHDGPPVVGDDYSLPGGWIGKSRIERDELESLDPAEILVVEAWDQS